MRGFPIRASWIFIALSLVGGAGGIACAPPEDDGFVTSCNLPSDQAQSITGRWTSNPIFISFRDGQFNAYEMSLVMDAADTWNSFFGTVNGIQIFDYGTRASPRVVTRDKPISLCSNSLVNTAGQFTGSVTIYKDTTWPT